MVDETSEQLSLEWEDLQFAAVVRDTQGQVLGGDADLAAQATELATRLIEGDADAFELALEDEDPLTRMRMANEDFSRLVLAGLSWGVRCGNALCANYLGALCYMGDVVEQDMERARELYELADAAGLIRAMINLGYIFEYGRTGEVDYVRAYMQYAKAAALSGHYEALYKLGDMYARGQAVPRDLATAMRLYDRSLQAAADEVEQSQGAFRIAELISDPANTEYGIPYDPLGALRLYQLAERGLMVDIAQGQTYYRERLRAAVAGQERMRAVLQAEGGADLLM